MAIMVDDSTKICLVCQREFPGDSVVCPSDGVNLVRILQSANNVTIDRYRLDDRICRIGQWYVHFALDTQTNTDVVVSVADIPYLKDYADYCKVDREQFEREMTKRMNLEHPSLVKLLSFELSSVRAQMVFERVRGVSLTSLVDERGFVTPKRVWEIFAPIMDLLDYTESKSYFLSAFGPDFITISDGQPKLSDYGARVSLPIPADGPLSFQDRNPAFMSPEHCMGKQIYPVSEVFSVASLIFYSLLGTSAFRGSNVLEIASQVIHLPTPTFKSLRPDLHLSERLQDVLLKAMEKDHMHRYLRMKDFKEALDQAINAADANQGYEEGISPESIPLVSKMIATTASSGFIMKSEPRAVSIFPDEEPDDAGPRFLPRPKGMPSIADFYGGVICLLAFGDIIVGTTTASVSELGAGYAVLLTGCTVMLWRRCGTTFARIGVGIVLSGLLFWVSWLFGKCFSALFS